MNNIIERIKASNTYSSELRQARINCLQKASNIDDMNYMRLLNAEASRLRAKFEAIEKEIADYLSGCTNAEICEMAEQL